MASTLGVCAVGITVVAYVYLRAIVRREAASTRAEKWAAALDQVSDAMLSLSRVAVGLRNDTEVQTDSASGFSEQATNACKELRQAFRSVTGVSCRVTLKEMFIPVEEQDSGRNRVAVRNIVSVGSRQSTPRREGTDWVEENTDFAEIVAGSRSHYFSNDIFAELSKGYRNSHWGPDTVANARTGQDLPYASTIVWPVRSLVTELGPKAVWSTIGFLCVDSKETGVFASSLDVEIGEILAQAFYAVWPHGEVSTGRAIA